MDNLNRLSCFVKKDYKVPYNWTEYWNSSSVEDVSSEPKAIPVAAVTGILISFIIDVLLSLEYHKSSGSFKGWFLKIFNVKNISRTLLLTFVVLILPFTILFLILASVYKVFCVVIIRNKDKYFVRFLDHFDVFWSLEDDKTKSIINVLGIIESNCPYELASKIKEKLRRITLNNGSEKIFYRRKEKYGFYYWQKHNFVDMDQYVEIVDFATKSKCSNNVDDLEYLMTDLQNQTLPYDDEGLFKILITQQRVSNHKSIRGDYGIIFRTHHSVGDGVALIELLCQSLADEVDNSSVTMFTMPENCNQDPPRNLLDMVQKLLQIPICFVDGILRKPDVNALHGPSLNGKKIFKWTESDENLLMMVKDIKDNVFEINFSDILLTALSNGLRDFLTKKTAPVPEDIAVILPVRFPKTASENSMLKNYFSVTILDIPVKDQSNTNIIRNCCKIIRKSADPLTNYYFLKLVCNVFPKSILHPLLNSSQATMVFSNMPGPGTLNLCDGNTLNSLVFFVPHKGKTGLGVTALCYGGVLRFAAMADSALVSSSNELATILNGMVTEITKLHHQYVK